jgi:hypothetical protein
MADDITNTIVTNAQGPLYAQGDQGAMRQHPLPDQIEADRYGKSVAAVKSTGRGFLLTQLRPPGTV